MKKVVWILFLLPMLLPAQDMVVEELNLKIGKIALPGTLTYPKSKEKIPLVIFVHGSGNIDRNGNQAGTPIQANYIKTLGDSLNAHGIAFYRYDKRTATSSNLDKIENISINDFAVDVRIAIAHLKRNNRFSSINLIGHSQGSLVAMLAITDAVMRYISIAGAGETIDHTLIGQLNQQNPEVAKTAQEHFDELRQTDTIVKVNPFLMSIFAPRNQKFLKNWMAIDPTKEISKVNIPILILNGDADLQVKEIDAESLKKAQPKAELKIIPKMNHVLKEVNSMEENQKSYSDEGFPLSTALVGHIIDFIKS